VTVPSFADPPFACPPAQLVLMLPTPPSTNNLFFTIASGPRRRGRAKTPEYQDWIRQAGYRLNAQHPVPVPGKVILLIEVPEPSTKVRQDIANREKAVTDLLVTHGIIEGDDQRFVREITMRWAPVHETRVTVRPA
jgi:Holliday junction resolvase RusA-like endonuclease